MYVCIYVDICKINIHRRRGNRNRLARPGAGAGVIENTGLTPLV